MTNKKGSTEFYANITKDLLKKEAIVENPIVSQYQKRSRNEWHDTDILLKMYRVTHWAIVNDISSIGNIGTQITKNIDFEAINQYSEVLQRILEECIEYETLQTDRSKTLERARSLHLSCLLLMDIHTALERVKTFPSQGEIFYKILYYSYFSHVNLGGITLANSFGFKTACQYASYQNYNFHMNERTFYRTKNEAIQLFDSILWGVTTRELVESFINMHKKNFI